MTMEPVGELLSAHLDGALDPSEVARVEAAVAADPELAAELRSLARTRALVRDLPPVDPPFGFLERLVRRPAPSVAAIGRGTRVASVGACAAAVVLVLGIAPAPEPDPVAPDVAALADRHVETITAEPIAATRAEEGFEEVETGEVGAPFRLSPEVATLDVEAVYRNDEMVQVVYGDDRGRWSVFELPGTMEWSALPPTGERFDSGDDRAWVARHPGSVTAVLERDGLVFVVVGPGGAPVEPVLDQLPEGSDLSWEGWLREACDGATGSLGFDG